MSTETSNQVHTNHYCEAEGCSKWGGWGFARTKAEPVRWWCQEHYPFHQPSAGESKDQLQ